MRNAFQLLLLSFFLLKVSGQQNNFKIYNIEDGLPQSTIFSILQDSRGYLWIGTEGGGLCRFDGINFVTFTKKDGLTGNTIRCILEDSYKNLWIGTENGLTFFNGLHFKPITVKYGISGTVITSLAEDQDHNVLVGTNDGGLNLIRMSSKDSFSIKCYNQKFGLRSNFIMDIQIDKFNRIWLATLGGIDILTLNKDRDVVQWIKCPSGDQNELILTLAQDKNHNILFGTENSGVFYLPLTGIDSGKIISLTNKYKFHDNTIRDITCLRNNEIWFATDKAGIDILKNNHKGSIIVNYSMKTGLPTNQVLCIYQDREGNIWLGTNGSGLCRYIGDYFAHYSMKEGLTNNQVFGITQDNNEEYWVATYGGGLTNFVIKNDQFSASSFTAKNGLPDDYLTSLEVSRDNSLWIATANNGICKLKNGRIINYTEKNGLCSNHVNCIFIDKKDFIWCATEEGISKFDGERFFNIKESDGLINNEVQTILEDKFGAMWFGTLGGLVKIQGNSMTDYNEEEGLYEKRINTLACDSSGNILIGTLSGGLFELDRNDTAHKSIHLLANDSILSSSNVTSLIFLDNNTLIVGTDHGFDKLSLGQNRKIINVTHYDKSNGFIGVENNLNAIYKDKKGLIWFGTIKGLTCYNPYKENMSVLAPQTHIVDLNLFFERINWENFSESVKPWFNLPQHLKLPYYKNHLTFKFIGISLNNPSKISYSYMLEGWDVNWSPPKKVTEITYSGLSPGIYKFLVKAVNEKGIWNKEPITFSFEITPPFWKTLWFLILCIIVALFIVYSYIKYREKNLIREKKILEQKVVERTKEIAAQKLEIEIKNKDILDSIEYAKRIQDALLPGMNHLESAFSEHFILFKPRNIVSGDFYWITSLENKLILAVADCTGHGVPGAFMSMLGVAFFNEIVIKNSVDQANLILDQLRVHIIETLHKASDGMDVALCIFDFQSRKLTYAGAFNPVYILRNNEINFLQPDRMPIGYRDISEMKMFNQQITDIKDGDVIYLFSDGYKDQFGGPKSEKIKARLFNQWLLEIYQMPLSAQKEILNNRFEEWKGCFDQTDDVCVIGLKIKL